MEVGGRWVAALVPSWHALRHAWTTAVRHEDLAGASWRYQLAALRGKARKPSGEVSGPGSPAPP